MTAWVYILECGDGSLYVGSTNDLRKRVAEHEAGLGGRYTGFKRPVKLVFSYETAHMEEARSLEHQVKGWRRAKRLALVRGDYEALVELSKTARGRAKQELYGLSSSPGPSTGSGHGSGGGYGSAQHNGDEGDRAV